MSSFPYRQAPDPDRWPDARRPASGPERDFYRPPQESFSSPAASQDSVLGILSSCGLEPEDLSMLAELPEDILTLESLPQILQQIKGQKAPPPGPGPVPVQSFPARAPPQGKLGSVKPLAARPPSPPLASTSFSPAPRPSARPASREWEQLRRQPVQYPLHLMSSATAQPQMDRWPDRRSPPSSSSRVMVDQDLRPRPPSYGKEGSSFSTPLDRTRPSRFPTYRAVPPPLDERRRDSRPSYAARALDRARDHAPVRAPVRAPDRNRDFGAMPSKKQALDFHGTSPSTFPYTCSLCDITVLSEKVWLQHVNTSGHADGQLNLLQRFPKWDCRLENVRKDDDQSQQQQDGPRPAPPKPAPPRPAPPAARPAPPAARPAPPAARPDQSRDPPPARKQPQKASDKGKVVCAKFAPQAVDEASLRKLIEPFGKIGKILMFPSLAFVEMGSCEEAKELVKFYSGSDPAAKSCRVDFSISNAFSFLQSSQVVSFTPAPPGEDGRSDLISIAKRFGEPVYTLFLPSKAFVEMKLPGEAQKLVDYYSTNILRINGDTFQVSFSSEYHTLMRVPSAQKYEDEPPKAKEPARQRRSRSRDRSRSVRKRSRSRDRKRRETRTRTRSRSRDKSKNKSRSTERSSARSPRKSRTEEKPKEPHKSEPRPADQPEAGQAAAAAEEPLGDEEQPAADDSDIEGMEVIAEDGEKVEDSYEEECQEEKREEHQEEEETPGAGEATENLEAEVEKPKEVKMEEEEQQKPAAEEEEEEDTQFPLDLDSCITLDEVKTDDEDEPRSDEASAVPEEDQSRAEPEPPRDSTEPEGSEVVSRTQRETASPDQNPPRIDSETRTPAKSSRTRSRKVLETSEGAADLGSTGGSEEEPSPRMTRSRNSASRTTLGKRARTPDDTATPPKTVRSREAEPEPEAGPQPEPEAGPQPEPEAEPQPEPEAEPQPEPEAEPQPEPEAEPQPEPEAGPEPEPEAGPQPELEAEPEPEPEAAAEDHGAREAEPQLAEQEAEPAEDATEPERRPVGAEFIRPVVGYFCHLCQLIFADEDEAKQQHCATPAHYAQYQERTGCDPWTS